MKRKLYLVLDCETAALPCVSKYARTERTKQNVSIAKPLIYDLGWKVIDRTGNIYKERSFLITEIFSVPEIFNTAYYKEKRPLYLEKLRQGRISLVDWNTAINYLVEDMQGVYAVGAYNAMFDFKKAIPFTELYISKLYSDDLQNWLKYQEGIVAEIAAGERKENTKEFDPDIFRFRGQTYSLFDIWGIACEKIINTDKYRRLCLDSNNCTASGKYFKTSAEMAFRYISSDADFVESHTALEDVNIECEILLKALRRGAITIGIIYFPFRLLGTVEQFEIKEQERKWAV